VDNAPALLICSPENDENEYGREFQEEDYENVR
jgi:hypothetical protein